MTVDPVTAQAAIPARQVELAPAMPQQAGQDAAADFAASLKVAATRSELTRIEKQIDRTRDNIRYLESELAVRASMRQPFSRKRHSTYFSAHRPETDAERKKAPRCRGLRFRGAPDC